MGGAVTGTTLPRMAGPADLPAPIGAFSAFHPVAPSGAFYALSVGGNDLSDIVGSPNPAAVAAAEIAKAMGNIATAVTTLAGAGATHFVFLGAARRRSL